MTCWTVSFTIAQPSGPTRFRVVERSNLSLDEAAAFIAHGLERSEYAVISRPDTGLEITVTPDREALTAALYVGAHGQGLNHMIDALVHIPETDKVLSIGEQIKEDPASAGRRILSDPALSKIHSRIRRTLLRRKKAACRPLKTIRHALLRRGWRIERQPPLGFAPGISKAERAADRWMTAYWAVALDKQAA